MTKQITIKIGRNEYHHEVIKADIKSPVLGWDFIRRNRFDFIWTDFGDITINDKKANISAILTYKALPLEQSLKLKKLARLDSHVVIATANKERFRRYKSESFMLNVAVPHKTGKR